MARLERLAGGRLDAKENLWDLMWLVETIRWLLEIWPKVESRCWVAMATCVLADGIVARWLDGLVAPWLVKCAGSAHALH